MLVSGCATLEPIALPASYAQPPSEAPLWLGLAEIRTDDWVELLNTHEEALEWRLRAIDSATQSIDLQTFLWDDDEVGLTILRHVFDAADRGVKVRLLLDDTFTISHAAEIWNISHHQNIEYRVYNPFLRRVDGFFLRQFMNLGDFARLNHRMHNKVLIVDGRVAISGGRNLANEYFGAHEEANFRDLETVSAGIHVKALSDLFDTFWNNPWTFPEDRLQSKPIGTRTPKEFAEWMETHVERGINETDSVRGLAWRELVESALPAEIDLIADMPAPSDPGNKDEFPNQLAIELAPLLEAAEEEIILVSAYLIPTPELEAVIQGAEDRGVSVTILTNSLQSTNHISAHSAYRNHLKQLLADGADVHEVRPYAKDRTRYMRQPVEEKQLGLHAKFLLIDDDTVFIGSPNLDPRSLRLNTEMALLITSEAMNQRLRSMIVSDFSRRNAWQLEQQSNGSIHWLSDEERLTKQPAASNFQRLEDWFLSLLPVEDQL